jgi:hypothetical protein
MTDYLENKTLDHTLGTTAYAKPAAVYVGLFTTAPADAGGGTEVSGGGYARKTATFAAATGGSTSNNADITFDVATANWGTITAIGVLMHPLLDNFSGGGHYLHLRRLIPMISSKSRLVI